MPSASCLASPLHRLTAANVSPPFSQIPTELAMLSLISTTPYAALTSSTQLGWAHPASAYSFGVAQTATAALCGFGYPAQYNMSISRTAASTVFSNSPCPPLTKAACTDSAYARAVLGDGVSPAALSSHAPTGPLGALSTAAFFCAPAHCFSLFLPPIVSVCPLLCPPLRIPWATTASMSSSA